MASPAQEGATEPPASSPSISLSNEQLQALLNAVGQSNTGRSNASMAQCPVTFDGKREISVVEEFTTRAELYRKVEKISDADALISLPLLLTGEAQTWWRGVSGTIKSWKTALERIHASFAPKRPNHELFAMPFATRQSVSEPIEAFLAEKRAILAAIPHDFTTALELDMTYGLLNLQIRKKISRDDFKTFEDLITKGRHVKSMAREQAKITPKAATRKETQAATPLAPEPSTRGDSSSSDKQGTRPPRPKCAYCGNRGHDIVDCRKLKAKEQEAAAPAASNAPPMAPKAVTSEGIKCYGCGNPGFVRSRCPKCQGKMPATTANLVDAELAFCALSRSRPRARPNVTFSVAGARGEAYLDTGAVTSVASTSLHSLLQKRGVASKKSSAVITLADGSRTEGQVDTYLLPITLQGRTLTTEFIVLPESEHNRTLLGCDFIEDSGIVINAAEKHWYFYDEPDIKHKYRAPSQPQPAIGSAEYHINVKSAAPSPIQDNSSTSAKRATASEQQPAKRSREDPFEPFFDNYENYTAVNEEFVKDWLQDHMCDTLAIAAVDVRLRPDEAPTLNERQRERLNNLLEEFASLFEEDGPPTTFAEHRIDTGDSPPIAVPPYRLSPAKREILKSEISKMLRKGVLEEGESPWISNVVLVNKKNGDTRVWVDYRPLNKVTVPEPYPLPRIDDLLHSSKKATCMSSLDLRSGYWLIPLRKEDKPKTAFVTPFGI